MRHWGIIGAALLISSASVAAPGLESGKNPPRTPPLERALALAQAQEMAALARDRLKYKQKRVNEGLAEAPAMWPRAKAAKQAEHKAVAATADYRARLETVSRKFGGELWKRLRALLAAHVRQNTPARDSSAVHAKRSTPGK